MPKLQPSSHQPIPPINSRLHFLKRTLHHSITYVNPHTYSPPTSYTHPYRLYHVNDNTMHAAYLATIATRMRAHTINHRDQRPICQYQSPRAADGRRPKIYTRRWGWNFPCCCCCYILYPASWTWAARGWMGITVGIGDDVSCGCLMFLSWMLVLMEGKYRVSGECEWWMVWLTWRWQGLKCEQGSMYVR